MDIKTLVDQFRYNIKDYTSWSFNETNTRQQFIDKFFELLGWDVNNHFWRSEQYKEVVLEDKLKIWWQAKAPDYSFRLWGRRIFFVEAKKPSVNIKDDVEPAYQIRRYSWTAKLPIGILTDFEELAIYDTRIKPNPTDKAGTARIKYFTFEEFEENREWIYSTLSKEAVEKWALDKYIQESKKTWTLSVDVDFLNMIDDWRDALAKNIYLRYGNERNRNLDRLNNIVGDIVDKIIFLRIAEDKKIENSWNLETIANGKEIWKTLIKYFEVSDKKYNSWLFDNTEIFKKFELDDKILKKILLSLYYPACPYEFSVLGVDILGNIYEKFLGKTLVKEWRTIKTEFKPDVKKAWGVFYTPQYIVDYIVKNTVGELLKWKTPKQALELDIVDPACGSGAFLIGAYDYILNWFLEQHTLNDEVIKKSMKEGKIYQFKNWYHLSFAYKKEILKNMIYGVDIDRQAVAVSRLSLLLKLLEWETAETANQLFSTIDAALLPKLDNNIKCGNSLVDSSIYGSLWVVDETTIKKINAFDWEKEFTEVFSKWGFDAVIGNPPYIEIQKLQSNYPVEISFIKQHYITAKNKNIDLYIAFFERGINILKEKWLLWLITPNRFFTSDYWTNLRSFLQDYNIYNIVNFRHYLVFDSADTYTTLMFISKEKQQKNIKYIETKDFFKTNHISIREFLFDIKNIFTITKDFKQKDNRYLMNKQESELFNKIYNNNKYFDDYYDKFFVGIQTSKDDFYILKLLENIDDTYWKYYSKCLDKEIVLEKWILLHIISDPDIKNYFIDDSWWNYVIFPYTQDWKLIDQQEIKNTYPKVWDYFLQFKNILEDRENGKMKWNNRYGYVYPKNIDKQKYIKILVPHVVKKMRVAYDESWQYAIKNVGANGITIKSAINHSPKFFLWLLNSPIATFVISKISICLAWWFYAANKQFSSKIPIPSIDFSNSSQKKQHDDLVLLVDQMLLAQKKLREVEFDDDKKVIQKQIEIIDGKIDNLVFDLYGLSEEEVRVVEGR